MYIYGGLNVLKSSNLTIDNHHFLYKTLLHM